MIASLVAYLISRQYQRVPLFDMLARQDWLVLPTVEELREHMSLLVEEAMQYDAVIAVVPRENISEVARLAAAKPGAPLLVYARAGEWRLLDRDEIARLAAQSSGDGKIADASSKGPLPYLFRDQSLEDALHSMSDWPVLPVVNRGDLGRLEGVITLDDILRAFRNASSE